jgi:hypothetical protein
VVSSHTKLIFNGTKTINKFSSSYLEEKYQDKEQGGKKRGGFRVETRTKREHLLTAWGSSILDSGDQRLQA